MTRPRRKLSMKDAMQRVFDTQLVPEQEAQTASADVEAYNKAHDQKGRFTGPGGGGGGSLEGGKKFREITEVRGNSRPVSSEEFQRLAGEGQAKLDAMRKNGSPPDGLDRHWDQIKEHAYGEAQKSWGGVTVDAHTGQALHAKTGYVLSIKNEATSVSIREGASRAEFDAGMDSARKKFGGELAMQGAHLGVFHDDDLHRIDVDPVVVVPTLHDVETIGAASHAIGGAYNYADGNGYWPPHVAAKPSKAAAGLEVRMASSSAGGRHYRGLGEWYANVRKTQHGKRGGASTTPHTASNPLADRPSTGDNPPPSQEDRT